MQDSADNWIWGPKNGNQKCGSLKIREEMTVLVMVDEFCGQDFRPRAWFWSLWGAVLDFHRLAQKMPCRVFTWAEGKMTLRELQGGRITTAEEPEGRRTKAKIVRGKDISELERTMREVRKLRLGARATGSRKWSMGAERVIRWNQWASFLVSWLVEREEGEAGRVKDRVNGFWELLMRA